MPETIDFDDLAHQALEAPAGAGTAAALRPPPNSGADYDGLAGNILGMQRAMATQNLLVSRPADT